jgi:hypothetical protein
LLLCKKIKIEVNDHDAAALEFMQAKCRGLYNWWVMRLRSGERWNLKQAKQSLQESKAYDPELRFVYGKLLAEVYFRLDKAMQAFFLRVVEGEKKPGFPRVKPRHQFFSERDTTKMCHVCKHLQDMPLWKRTYRCVNENCGLVMDRDENSAVNIYQRFVAGLPPHR